MTNDHPTSDELLEYVLTAQNLDTGDLDTRDLDARDRGTRRDSPGTAADGGDDDTELARTERHLDSCVACRVRVTRLSHAGPMDGPSDDAVGRLMMNAPTLSGTAREFLTSATRDEPAPGEVWRVGTDDALLVWVRKVVNATTLDVIPLVFDTEMADSESLLLADQDTTLGVPTVALVSVRTHIHRDAFLTRLGHLDINSDVEALLTLSRGGSAQVDAAVGTPIESADDRRIEFRQLVADLLGELSPVVYNDRLAQADGLVRPGEAARQRIEAEAGRVAQSWEVLDSDFNGQPPPFRDYSIAELFETLRQDLTLRLGPSLVCTPTKQLAETTPVGKFVAFGKVHYIDTTVLVVLFEADGIMSAPADVDDAGRPGLVSLPAPEHVPAGVASLLRVEADAQGVAVTVTGDTDRAMLLTRADLRPALVLPDGSSQSASVTITGHTLADTLVKFLDGEPAAWEALDQTETRLPKFDFDHVARTHAAEALTAIRKTGTKSPQPAKKAAWANMDADVVDAVSAFIEAARHENLDAALDHLGLDSE